MPPFVRIPLGSSQPGSGSNSRTAGGATDLPKSEQRGGRRRRLRTEGTAVEVDEEGSAGQQVNQSAAKGKKGGKAKKTEQGQADHAKLVMALAKLVMSIAMSTRELQGIVLDFHLLQSTHPFVLSMAAAGAAYAKAVEQFKTEKPRERHPFGPPYLQAFVGLVEAISKYEGMDEDIVRWAEGFVAEPPEDMNQWVRCCRIMKTFKGEQTKLVFHISSQEVRKFLMRAMAKAKAEHRVGRFPPMAIESVVDRLMEHLDA